MKLNFPDLKSVLMAHGERVAKQAWNYCNTIAFSFLAGGFERRGGRWVRREGQVFGMPA